MSIKDQLVSKVDRNIKDVNDQIAKREKYVNDQIAIVEEWRREHKEAIERKILELLEKEAGASYEIILREETLDFNCFFKEEGEMYYRISEEDLIEFCQKNKLKMRYRYQHDSYVIDKKEYVGKHFFKGLILPSYYQFIGYVIVVN